MFLAHNLKKKVVVIWGLLKSTKNINISVSFDNEQCYSQKDYE